MWHFINNLWPWLISNQNAAGVQAVVAALGLVGLTFYTFYTRKMMKIQVETRRAELFPAFALRSFDVNSIMTNIEFLNVGKGAAINLQFWFQPVSSEFSLSERWKPQPVDTSVSKQFLGALAPGSHYSTQIAGAISPNAIWVLEGNDTQGGHHQLVILRKQESAGNYTVQQLLYLPAAVLPWHKRLFLNWQQKKKQKQAFESHKN